MAKKVRFYAGVEIDKDGTRHTWSADAWQRFMNSCKKESQAFEIRGRKIAGQCESCYSPAVFYMHLTKNRELSDWPEAGDASGSVSNLATRRDQTGIISILEYTYLLPVSGTPYIALLRSSSGPMPSAIADWVSLKSDMPATGKSFELQPVLRNDARQKLNESLGVKSLEVRFEGKPDPNSTSSIERAAAEAASTIDESDYANVKIDMSISMGRATVVSNSTEAMRKQALSILTNNNIAKHPIKDMLSKGWVTKLKAKTLQANPANPESNKPIIEPVDFIKEHLTEDADFGSMKDDEMTPAIILSGMLEAIGKFRKRSNEY